MNDIAKQIFNTFVDTEAEVWRKDSVQQNNLSIRLPDPLKTKFVFQFPNGDKVECPDCHSLQDFLDKLNRYGDLKEKLEIAVKALDEIYRIDDGNSFFLAEEALAKIKEID